MICVDSSEEDQEHSTNKFPTRCSNPPPPHFLFLIFDLYVFSYSLIVFPIFIPAYISSMFVIVSLRVAYSCS